MWNHPVRHGSLVALVAIALAACGGGDDDTTPAAGAGAAGGAVTLSCNTAGYVAGSVELPTATQLAAYAGTYNGDEGQYGPKPGDPFVKSGSAAVVLGADGKLSYKGVAYTITSACVDKTSGTLGKVLYIVAGKGHLDIADKVDPSLGQAWGVSLADGDTIYTKGLK